MAYRDQLRGELLLVLVKESCDIVFNLAGEVADEEFSLTELVSLKLGVSLVVLDDLLQEALVSALGEASLLIQQQQDANGALERETHA